MSVYKCHVNITVKKGTKLKIIGPVYKKNDTTIYEMDELVDHCLIYFEKFHKQYIIMPSL